MRDVWRHQPLEANPEEQCGPGLGVLWSTGSASPKEKPGAFRRVGSWQNGAGAGHRVRLLRGEAASMALSGAAYGVPCTLCVWGGGVGREVG